MKDRIIAVLEKSDTCSLDCKYATECSIHRGCDGSSEPTIEVSEVRYGDGIRQIEYRCLSYKPKD